MSQMYNLLLICSEGSQTTTVSYHLERHTQQRRDSRDGQQPAKTKAFNPLMPKLNSAKSHVKKVCAVLFSDGTVAPTESLQANSCTRSERAGPGGTH